MLLGTAIPHKWIVISPLENVESSHSQIPLPNFLKYEVSCILTILGAVWGIFSYLRPL